MPSEASCIAVHFLSQRLELPEEQVNWTDRTAQGREISASGIRVVGSPLVRGISDAFGVRPYAAHPWPEFPSIGAVQFVDPYGEQRWPSYIMFRLQVTLPHDDYSVEAAQDICQYLRGIVGWGAFNHSPFSELVGEKISVPGYRWAFWTPSIDFVHNPTPTGTGSYAPANADEAVGPGFVVVENGSLGHMVSPDFIGTDGQLNFANWGDYLAQRHLALVWSQAFSLSSRTTTVQDATRIEKRVREIQRHWNSYGELQDAERHLAQQDLKAAVRSAAPSVEAAIRFYSTEWGVAFPDVGEFTDKIEAVLAQAGRPSYAAFNPDGLTEILHLYRARNAMHEGGNSYRDKRTGELVEVYLPIASVLVEEAKRLCLWLDTQA